MKNVGSHPKNFLVILVTQQISQRYRPIIGPHLTLWGVVKKTSSESKSSIPHF